MALSKKRKCHFTEQIQKEFPFIRPCRPGQDDTVVHCTLCQSSFSIASGGRYSVVEHQQTKKHKKGLTANALTPTITTFYKKTEPSQKEFELAVQEGILAYHTMKHNHSYRSMDCTAQLTKKLYEPKFSCGRTKGEAIVNNVFAPWATNMVRQDLEQVEFVSLSIDSSNHGHLKLLPLIVRYCKANDGSMSIETKLLDFVELKGEKAEELAAEIMVVIEKFSLENKVVAFSADNTNTNFGGLNRVGRINVHTKVKNALQREVIGLGCPAHIIHNATRTAMDTLPIDVEYLLTKIFGYFHIYTVRVERLKSFCEFVGQEYQKILGHSNVRWLSMLPALERVLKMYAPLKAFFLSEEKCPVVLRRMFEDPLTELWLAFAHGNLAIFSETIKKLEGQDRCAVESAAILREVEIKLTARRDDSFIPVLARGLLGELVENAAITRENFLNTTQSFFTMAVNYLQAWGKHTDNLNDLHCLLLKNKPLREEIQKATATLQEKCPNVKIKEDDLFDEVSALHEFLKGESLLKWREIETPLSQRWSTVFTHFKENDIPHTNLARLVSVVMCLPGSNAPVERVFSQMNDIWTDSRNRFTVPSIKAILIVKTNINLLCDKFMEMLAKDRAIQKKIHSSEKYANQAPEAEVDE
ncbi:uncharacterized protein LOC128438617 isoform X2 [Pleuronectes platessa]|uniref:uncharacterized protein LOC128438617 isoform X2 n=1 Tax=Pleuronectes platessa TaxID=8262 RepID=UPI00232A3C66|nr:uncharacterized protein LOC128438617 isoform X2 [Pleuronectes platessa]